MDAGTPLFDFFHAVYRPLKLRGRGAGGTVRLYGCTMRSFAEWLGRPPLVSDLDELVLSRFLEGKASPAGGARPWSPFTAEKARTQLCALARLAFERRMLQTMPVVPPTVLPRRVPVAWSVDELRRVYAAAAAVAGELDGIRKADALVALLGVLWDTAERVSAVLDTPASAYRRPHLLVAAEARKGGRADRLYTLSPETCEAVERVAGRHDGALVPWPWTRTGLWRVFGRVVTAAGVRGAEPGSRVRFHMVRRTAASHYAAAGGDAVELLGHSSPVIARRHYLDPTIANRSPPPCAVLPGLSPGVRHLDLEHTNG